MILRLWKLIWYSEVWIVVGLWGGINIHPPLYRKWASVRLLWFFPSKVELSGKLHFFWNVLRHHERWYVFFFFSLLGVNCSLLCWFFSIVLFSFLCRCSTCCYLMEVWISWKFVLVLTDWFRFFVHLGLI